MTVTALPVDQALSGPLFVVVTSAVEDLAERHLADGGLEGTIDPELFRMVSESWEEEEAEDSTHTTANPSVDAPADTAAGGSIRPKESTRVRKKSTNVYRHATRMTTNLCKEIIKTLDLQYLSEAKDHNSQQLCTRLEQMNQGEIQIFLSTLVYYQTRRAKLLPANEHEFTSYRGFWWCEQTNETWVVMIVAMNDRVITLPDGSQRFAPSVPAPREQTKLIAVEMSKRGTSMQIWPFQFIPIHSKHELGNLNVLHSDDAAVRASVGRYVVQGFSEDSVMPCANAGDGIGLGFAGQRVVHVPEDDHFKDPGARRRFLLRKVRECLQDTGLRRPRVITWESDLPDRPIMTWHARDPYTLKPDPWMSLAEYHMLPGVCPRPKSRPWSSGWGQ